ncbi:unnamed protein product, partial [Prorocentrum cordatum]
MVAAGDPLRGVQRGAAGARASADRLVFKLKDELQACRHQHSQVIDMLAKLFDAGPEIVERILAVVPDLQAKVRISRSCGADTLRRNLALHAKADGISVLTALVKELRIAEKGPRLEKAAGSGGPTALRADAEAFVPAAGRWVALPPTPGFLCTCGAVVFRAASGRCKETFKEKSYGQWVSVPALALGRRRPVVARPFVRMALASRVGASQADLQLEGARAEDAAPSKAVAGWQTSKARDRLLRDTEALRGQVPPAAVATGPLVDWKTVSGPAVGPTPTAVVPPTPAASELKGLVLCGVCMYHRRHPVRP